MPEIELIRFDNPDRYIFLHHMYHAKQISFLVFARPDGSQWRGDILACHPELCGFSIAVNG